MALSRINGDQELYVGGVFGLCRVQTLEEKGITHILSVIDYSLEKYSELRGKYAHMSVDVDDVEDADLLVHFPKMVRFIDAGLSKPPSPSSASAGGVYVHCAMGKSRSVTAVCAYLLHKHPHRFGAAADRRRDCGDEAARAAADAAVRWVRQTREIAEPNPGFMEQLALWWRMGSPVAADDAVERHPLYQRWRYRREVEESVKLGRAPDWVRFEDEEQQQQQNQESDDAATAAAGARDRVEFRCKKCRRVLTTQQFVVPHRTPPPTNAKTTATPTPPCPHVFVEPLSWMRPALEPGELEGRLVCPGVKCGASIGRYSWLGFKCSCAEWVCPAFSLQRSKVDQVPVVDPSSPGSADDPRARLGIRMPPSLRKENL